MRVKLFEEYSNPLYYELDEYDEEDIIGNVDKSKFVTYVEFNDIDKVRDLLDKNKGTLFSHQNVREETGYIDLDYQQIKYPFKSLAISGVTNKDMPDFVSANILKADDEWYYVEYFEFEDEYCILQRRFKCDQFEGLKKLLSDLKLIKDY